MRRRSPATAAVAGLLMLMAACTSDPGGSAQDSGGGAVGSAESRSAATQSVTTQSALSQPPVTDAAGLGGSLMDPTQFVAAVGPSFQGVTSITGSVTIDGPNLTEDGTYRGTVRNGQVTGMSVDMSITAQGKALTLTMVEVGGNLFVRSAALASELHLTKPWLSISENSSNPDLAQVARTLSAILDGIGPPEYTQFAAEVLAASDLGSDTIDGAPARHLRALIDPDASVAALDLTASPPSARSPGPTAPSAGPKGEVVPVRVDVWLDQQGRSVTTTTTQTLADQQIVSTNDVTSFNAPVTITAPAPSDVATG